MRRINLLGAAFFLSLTLTDVSSEGNADAAEPQPARPNILFLLSDDHSYPYLGCYGCTDVRTPSLDRLAEQGMRFDRMFVGCPQCVPSRATLMTGRSAVAVRMVRFTSPLPADLPALPDQLRDRAGYFTGCRRASLPPGWTVRNREARMPGDRRGDPEARVADVHQPS